MLADSGARHALLIDSPAAPADHRVIAQQSSVGPGYFETLGIPILRGRALTAADRADSRPVAVVNQTLAERFWPGESPLGKRIPDSQEVVEIVGVARDVKYNTLGEERRLYIYLPIAQEYTAAVTLHVRTRGAAEAALAALRRQMRAVAPEDAAHPGGDHVRGGRRAALGAARLRRAPRSLRRRGRSSW